MDRFQAERCAAILRTHGAPVAVATGPDGVTWGVFDRSVRKWYPRLNDMPLTWYTLLSKYPNF